MTEQQYLTQLGKRISEKRISAGLSQEVLGKKVELSRMHIYRIEQGETPTSIVILRRLARVFKITLSELVDI